MTEPRPRIFLIDGSSYIFRAFFAIPPLSNARCLPTNTILGFTNMLLRLVKQHRPEYIAVLLDAGRETFRNQMFAAYKGTAPIRRRICCDNFPTFARFSTRSIWCSLRCQGMKPTTSSLLSVGNWPAEKVRVLFNELGFFNLLKLLEFNQPA
jgi:hypothetical protein